MKTCLAFVVVVVFSVVSSEFIVAQAVVPSTDRPAGGSPSTRREKERQLRIDLREMRDAIDHYRGMADRGKFPVMVGSQGYPPDLETLLKGVDVQGKEIHFLRKIPVDPMTGTTDWGLREAPHGGLFDVYTKSQGTALDGTKYKDW